MGDAHSLAKFRMSGLRNRKAAAADDERDDEYEPLPDHDDDKYYKYRTRTETEKERKAKVVMYITLVMWIVMIIGMFYKIGEGLYMAYLRKHGILHTYSA